LRLQHSQAGSQCRVKSEIGVRLPGWFVEGELNLLPLLEQEDSSSHLRTIARCITSTLADGALNKASPYAGQSGRELAYCNRGGGVFAIHD
jgi:hypothetical protein